MLPIEPYLESIMAMINENPICAIRASTGTGKSTLIPPYYATHSDRKQHIIVVEPTVVACVRNAERVKQLYPNLWIGIGAGHKITYNRFTDIAFVTAGHAEIVFGKNRDFPNATVVIFDEMHTASPEYETLLLIVSRESHSFRIVMLSATMNNLGTFPILEVEAKMFPIQETFANRDYYMNGMDQEQLLIDSVEYLMDKNQKMQPGHFLVFCPGQDVIEKMHSLLFSPRYNDQFANCCVYLAFSSMPSEYIDYAFSQLEPMNGERSIILATDIAETSVTIPHIVLVFDLGLQKMTQLFNDEEASMLVVSQISQFASQQRRGRTGRTCEGSVHHMFSRERFDNMPKCYEPALKRVPLFDTVLKLASYEMNPTEILKDVVESTKVQRCLQFLIREGLIHSESNTLSMEAKEICYLPIQLRLKRVFYLLGSTNDWKQKCIGSIMCALVEVEGNSSLAYIPYRKRNEPNEEYINRVADHREKFARFEMDSCCPLNTSVNVILAYMRENKNGWSVQNGMNNKTLHNVMQILRHLGIDNIVDEMSNYEIRELFQLCIPMFCKRFDCIMMRNRDKWQFGEEKYFLNTRGFEFDHQFISNRILVLCRSMSKKLDNITKIAQVYLYL